MPPPAFVPYVVIHVPEISDQTSHIGIFRSLSGLEVSFDVLEYHEGGNNEFVHRLPGRLRHPNLVLSWGIVNDETLLKWFFATHVEAKRKEMTLTLTASRGDDSKAVRKFHFADAFPVRWSGPQLSADSDAQSWGETLEIAHTGLTLT